MTADGILIAALLAMSTGRVPMYVTAVIGGVAALLAAGVPLMGDAAGGVPALLKGALRPLPVVDMLGILLFIGVMKQSGCMEAILYKLMESGRKHGARRALRQRRASRQRFWGRSLLSRSPT